MLKGGNPLTVGVGIVIEVIRKNNSDYDPEFIEGPNSMPTVNDPIYLGSLLRLFARHVPDFMRLILSDTTAVNDGGRYEVVPRKQLHTAAGVPVEALGFDRFKTCELMAELLHCSNMGLLNEVGSEEYIRRRDAERKKLLSDGVMGVWRESGAEMDGDASGTQGDSVFMYGDNSSNQFLGGSQTPSSVLGMSTSSERIDQSDLSLGSNPEGEVGAVTTLESDKEEEDDDDDGFEDVSIMRDELERNKKTGYGPGGAETDADQGMTGLVDEPLTPPKNSKENASSLCKSSHSQLPEEPNSVPPRAVSPTSEITNRLESLSIEQEKQKEEKKKEVDATPAAASEEGDSISTTPPETPVPASAVPAAISTTPPLAPATLATDAPKTEEQEREDEERDLDRVDLSKYNDGLIQIDVDGQPVIGDYLKIKFVENQVVPTILVRFFKLPLIFFTLNALTNVN